MAGEVQSKEGRALLCFVLCHGVPAGDFKLLFMYFLQLCHDNIQCRFLLHTNYMIQTWHRYTTCQILKVRLGPQYMAYMDRITVI